MRPIHYLESLCTAPRSCGRPSVLMQDDRLPVTRVEVELRTILHLDFGEPSYYSVLR